MKLIVAIIRPEKLEAVQNALAERDVYLMTVSDVRGCGRQRGFTEVYRGTEVQIRLIPKLKLEIAVNEPFVEATVEAIVHAARTGDTGTIGDGKIFVLSLKTASASAPANAAAKRSDHELTELITKAHPRKGWAFLLSSFQGACRTKSTRISRDHPMRHPLEPLSAAEVSRAIELLAAAGKVTPTTRFVSVMLKEPLKSVVHSGKEWDALPRAAAVVLFDNATNSCHEAELNLSTAGTIDRVSGTFPVFSRP